MPHFGEFPNLERLNLEGCIKLMPLDASIALLTKLVYLNLRYCKNLFSRSSLLKWNMLPYHSTTHTNLFPSWHSLRDLDISFCGLRRIPDAIGCLYWLEGLNLGGNNFVTVPSLRKLSKLVYLNLEHCKLLKSLPQLPSPTAIKCELNPFRADWWIYGLYIFNCPKLGEREHWSSITFSWMIQLIQANPQFSLQIVTPGSEIPSWFKNWNKGNSIKIDSSPVVHDSNNSIIGCVFCVVFSTDPTMIRSCLWDIQMVQAFRDIHGQGLGICRTHIPISVNESLITVKSNHIWLIYSPLKSFLGIFDEILYADYNNNKACLRCGYRWVYKEDLQEFNLTKLNNINTLAGKRKFLAIEEEA